MHSRPYGNLFIRPKTDPIPSVAERPLPDQLPAVQTLQFFAAATAAPGRQLPAINLHSPAAFGRKAAIRSKISLSHFKRLLQRFQRSHRTAAFQNPDHLQWVGSVSSPDPQAALQRNFRLNGR